MIETLRPVGGRSSLAVVAVAALAITVGTEQQLGLVTVPLSLVLLVFAFVGRGPTVDPARLRRLILGVVLVFAIISSTGPHHLVIGEAPRLAFVIPGLVWLGLGLWWYFFDPSPSMLTRICIAVVAGAGVLHLLGAQGWGPDVQFLHLEAAEAIASGVSPYSAQVSVPNGAPVPVPPFIDGYPYPPSVAIVYTASTLVLGDPRWINLAAWLVTLGLIGGVTATGSSKDRAGLVILLSALPTWPYLLTGGWTEPLTLVMFAVAARLWHRPSASGLIGGLALGTKQYLAFLAPALLVGKPPSRWRRLVYMAVGLLVGFAPLAIWGVSGFYEAAIEFHLNTLPRYDGTSLVGLLALLGVEVELPRWLPLITLGVALAVGRRMIDVTSTLIGMGIVLSTAFILSSQAFENYWFLVMGLVALAVTQIDPERHSDQRSVEKV